MKKMYQQTVIVGNLGADPEMRYMQDGTPVTNFSVATSRKWGRPDGTQGDETVWFRVTAWRRLAETCNQYLQKGKQVLIEGRMNPDSATGAPRIWTGNDGVARTSYEVTASNIRFLSGRGEAATPDIGESPEEPPAKEEEEIPF